MNETSCVFAYGTLQIDEVMQAVTGRRFAGEPARLADHRRRRIAQRSYPGVVPHSGEVTLGVVFRDVDAATIAKLDVFEGELYERRALGVSTDTGEVLRAWTYVVAERHRRQLSDACWELDEFMLEHGEAFIASCRRFAGEEVV